MENAGKGFNVSNINYFQFSDPVNFGDEEDDSEGNKEELFELAPINQKIYDNLKTILSIPCVKLRNFHDLPLGPREKEGYLTDRLIEVCSSGLKRTLRPGKYALTHCDLSRKSLKCIEIISYHQYLQYLNLSRNYLTEITDLGSLRFLEYLDVSHNHLKKLLDFKAPFNLTYAIFSHNLIEEMPSDLQDFCSLVYLDVSHNLIKEIDGVHQLQFLQFLDLSSNYITFVKKIYSMPLDELYLDNNQISDCEDLEKKSFKTLNNCRSISISHNQLKSLKLVNEMRNLETLDASFNDILDLFEITHLKDCLRVKKVNLEGNPITKNCKYKQLCLSLMKRIQNLDGKVVDAEEKARALFQYKAKREVKARNQNSMLALLYHTMVPVMDDRIVPFYYKLASMVVLVGPIAGRKRHICQAYCDVNPDLVKVGIVHTTRPKFNHEVDGVHYHFVTTDHFNQLLSAGKILAFSYKYGYHFGICDDELKKVADGGVLIFTGDLNISLQLRARFVNCQLIFAYPNSLKKYKKWLLQHFQITPWISNFVKAYVLSYKAVKIESAVQLLQHKDFCTSILEDILQYIQDIHERNSSLENSVVLNTIDFDVSEKLPIVSSNRLSVSSKEGSSDKNAEFSQMSSKKLMFTDVNISYEASIFIDEETSSTSEANDSKSSEEGQMRASFDWNIKNMPQSRRSIGKMTKIRRNNSWLNADYFDMNNTNIPATISEFSHEVEYQISGTTLTVDANSNSLQSESVEESKTENVHEMLLKTASQCIHSSDSSDFLLARASSGVLDAKDETLCMEFFIEEQVRMRQLYETVSKDNPGLFVLTIHTDDVVNSLRSIDEIIRNCIKNRNDQFQQEADCQQQYICKPMHRKRLEYIFSSEMLRQ